jgi:hypothetical protein
VRSSCCAITRALRSRYRANAPRAEKPISGASGAYGSARDESYGVELRLLHVRVQADDALHARQRQRGGAGLLLGRIPPAVSG